MTAYGGRISCRSRTSSRGRVGVSGLVVMAAPTSHATVATRMNGGGPAPKPAAMATQSWPAAAKDLVMTALGSSRVWATIGQGILNEIFWPAVDQPQVRDFGFLVAGNGWWREVKRVDSYTLSTPDPVVALPTITHTADEYQLTLQVVV